ncbi:MAG: hypothetical protein WDM81_15500 [Rhizomicrobium sp.]
MSRTQNEVAEGVARIQNVIRHTGINPDDYTPPAAWRPSKASADRTCH